MNKILNRIFVLPFLILLLASTFNSCQKVTLKLEKIPANTPKGANIYLTGNFNFWDPGDERYIMEYNLKDGYFISLPFTFGKVEYKFTRGDWTTVERDRCGMDIENRVIERFDQAEILNRIESWADLEPLDCDSVVIVIEKLPRNTPKNSRIKIAGNFNAWNPANDEQFVLKQNQSTGLYQVTLRKKAGLQLRDFRFKIVRDSINQSESDRYGNDIETRKIDISKGFENRIEVENWIDLAEPSLNAVTIVLSRIPKTTPPGSSFYLVGNFNNWMPEDKKFMFRKHLKGYYYINIPRQKYGLSFKVTRGGWHTEAADKRGINFDNQDYNYNEIDTVFMAIDNWKDIKPQWSDYYTFVIDKLPAGTPKEQNIVLVGTYDEWHTREVMQTFEKDKNGLLSASLKKKKADLEYKITRGSWQTQEYIDNTLRTAAVWDDTIHLNLNQWSDQLSNAKDFIRLEITDLPRNTPENPRIYIAGGFNGWDPGDAAFRFKKGSNGNYFMDLPRLWLKQGFKFTRGNWETVETTRFGGFVENRVYSGNSPVLKISIAAWEN